MNLSSMQEDCGACSFLSVNFMSKLSGFNDPSTAAYNRGGTRFSTVLAGDECNTASMIVDRLAWHSPSWCKNSNPLPVPTLSYSERYRQSDPLQTNFGMSELYLSILAALLSYVSMYILSSEHCDGDENQSH